MFCPFTGSTTRLLLLAFSLVGAMVASPALGQASAPVLTGPTNIVVAGSYAPVWVLFLNPSEHSLAVSFPPEIPGSLRRAETVFKVTLTPGLPNATETVQVAPGSFVRREYYLGLPELISGEWTLVAELAGANRVLLEVRTPAEVAREEGGAQERGGLRQFVTEGQQKSKPYSAEQFFKEHFFGYEPIYFIAGTESPNAKFQLSLRYQLLSSEGALARHAPFLKGLSVAYTQASLWDWNAPSAPFFDTSYKPEVLYVFEKVDRGRWADWFRLDLQGGIQHESNGQSPPDSRSLNIAYFRPKILLGNEGGFQVGIIPRVWGYVGDLSDNPDIKDYRGYADLRLTAGWARGAQLSAFGRMGDDWEHGSLQLDLTYPMMQLLSGSFSVYLHAQYFTGYGESLLQYDQRSDGFRIGFALFR